MGDEVFHVGVPFRFNGPKFRRVILSTFGGGNSGFGFRDNDLQLEIPHFFRLKKTQEWKFWNLDPSTIVHIMVGPCRLPSIVPLSSLKMLQSFESQGARYLCLRLLLRVAAGRSIRLTWRKVKVRTGELWILDTARSHELESGGHDNCQP